MIFQKISQPSQVSLCQSNLLPNIHNLDSNTPQETEILENASSYCAPYFPIPQYIYLFLSYFVLFSDKASPGENSFSRKLLLLFVLLPAHPPSSSQSKTLTNLEHEKMASNLWKQSTEQSHQVLHHSNQASALLTITLT